MGGGKGAAGTLRTPPGRPLGQALADAVRPPRAPRLAASLKAVDAAATQAGRLDDWRRLTEANAQLAPLLAAVLDASPFLRDTAFADFPRLLALLDSDPRQRMRELTRRATALWRCGDAYRLMAELRRARS